jgi:hypothetical protein
MKTLGHMFTYHKDLSLRMSKILAVVAGVAYCSWPLGYVLNPLVSAKGLASELAALHQPFNWVFIVTDVVAGVLVTAVCVLLWRHDGGTHHVVLANFAVFGLFTAIGAAIPMSCEPSLTTCPSLSHQPILILHGVASFAASICLFVSAVMVWWQRRKQGGARIMGAFMAGYILFGALSLYFLIRPGPGYLSQHYYITLCSVWTAALPFMIVPQSVHHVGTRR